MALTTEWIEQQLTQRFNDQVGHFEEQYGILGFHADAAINLKILNFLNEPEPGFHFLTDICAVHYPDQPGQELAVVYHLHNIRENVRIRMKIFVDIQQPEVFTATGIFAAANWMERETYDFYGVRFIGHPNLIRILNVEEMDYFPMRKEFPLEDQSRTDKDDEMFGRGGMLGFGTEKTMEGTLAEDEKTGDIAER
ncbi:NADH-quinone oxidoreductase subunit C [Niabella terrae]